MVEKKEEAQASHAPGAGTPREVAAGNLAYVADLGRHVRILAVVTVGADRAFICRDVLGDKRWTVREDSLATVWEGDIPEGDLSDSVVSVQDVDGTEVVYLRRLLTVGGLRRVR